MASKPDHRASWRELQPHLVEIRNEWGTNVTSGWLVAGFTFIALVLSIFGFGADAKHAWLRSLAEWVDIVWALWFVVSWVFRSRKSFAS